MTIMEIAVLSVLGIALVAIAINDIKVWLHLRKLRKHIEKFEKDESND